MLSGRFLQPGEDGLTLEMHDGSPRSVRFEGEHGSAFQDAGWREIEWFKSGFLKGGMARIREDRGTNQHRERLWLSPHCLEGNPKDEQRELF